MFEVRHVFVNVAALHFEGEDIPPSKVLAHVVLEGFGEVIDNRGPDPFICVSSSEGDMFSNQLTGVLHPCFNSGSSNVPQK